MSVGSSNRPSLQALSSSIVVDANARLLRIGAGTTGVAPAVCEEPGGRRRGHQGSILAGFAVFLEL